MKSYLLTIRDNQQLLNEIALHQIENIVWLRLAPIQENIRFVDFDFRKHAKLNSPAMFASKISTTLKNGKIIHVEGVCDDQLESILLATDQMEKHVRNRVELKNRLAFKGLFLAAECLNRLGLDTKRRLVFWSRALSEQLGCFLGLEKGRGRKTPQL